MNCTCNVCDSCGVPPVTEEPPTYNNTLQQENDHDIEVEIVNIDQLGKTQTYEYTKNKDDVEKSLSTTVGMMMDLRAADIIYLQKTGLSLSMVSIIFDWYNFMEEQRLENGADYDAMNARTRIVPLRLTSKQIKGGVLRMSQYCYAWYGEHDAIFHVVSAQDLEKHNYVRCICYYCLIETSKVETLCHSIDNLKFL